MIALILDQTVPTHRFLMLIVGNWKSCENFKNIEKSQIFPAFCLRKKTAFSPKKLGLMHAQGDLHIDSNKVFFLDFRNFPTSACGNDVLLTMVWYNFRTQQIIFEKLATTK